MSCNCAKQAVNFAGAVVRAGAAMATNKPLLVEAVTKAARLAMCLTCPEMKTSDDKIAHLCTACGCWLDGQILCKACLATETCPKNLWLKS